MTQYKKIPILIGLVFFIQHSLANETCSRTAIVNFQEVVVDSSASRKGEGLRFFLAKDKVAESYLNEYQERSRMSWKTAAASTIGTGLMITGLFQADTITGRDRRKRLLVAGASLVIVSYLVSKTIQNNNEKYLEMAVDEYNRRNLPRIYFSPYLDEDGRGGTATGIQGGFVKEFE
jgi:hypothetical protein